MLNSLCFNSTSLLMSCPLYGTMDFFVAQPYSPPWRKKGKPELCHVVCIGTITMLMRFNKPKQQCTDCFVVGSIAQAFRELRFLHKPPRNTSVGDLNACYVLRCRYGNGPRLRRVADSSYRWHLCRPRARDSLKTFEFIV